MSLGLFVLRALTVKAIGGNTLAGNAVSSSAILPLDEVVREGATPYVVVFTDSFSTREDADIQGRDLMGVAAAVTLGLEIAVAARVPTEDQTGEEIVIPQTDEGLEMTLDLVHRQIIVALQCADTDWAELWRAFVLRVRSYRAERGASADRGVRFAARRLEIVVDVIDDPTPGAALTGLWADLLAAFEADDELAPLAPTLRAAAEGTAMPNWRRWIAELGLTRWGGETVAIGPEQEWTGSNMIVATEATADDEDNGAAISVTDEGATITPEGGAAVALVEVPQDG